ncbi:hypothetical protein PYW08_012488 [Mythimna loreyi]|uniref:Uncharacterized protein n=1 Tax=Mythimna loreyi TaxID=667449 RepID=A0ACC2Q162_9NEOP|nr:hypothetical protein PYW08_012488 [Mythimna loreyi]
MVTWSYEPPPDDEGPTSDTVHGDVACKCYNIWTPVVFDPLHRNITPDSILESTFTTLPEELDRTLLYIPWFLSYRNKFLRIKTSTRARWCSPGFPSKILDQVEKAAVKLNATVCDQIQGFDGADKIEEPADQILPATAGTNTSGRLEEFIRDSRCTCTPVVFDPLHRNITPDSILESTFTTLPEELDRTLFYIPWFLSYRNKFLRIKTSTRARWCSPGFPSKILDQVEKAVVKLNATVCDQIQGFDSADKIEEAADQILPATAGTYTSDQLEEFRWNSSWIPLTRITKFLSPLSRRLELLQITHCLGHFCEGVISMTEICV